MEAIKADLEWLGFKWSAEHFASDYFQQLYDFAVELIKSGNAFVDSSSAEQMREMRGTGAIHKRITRFDQLDCKIVQLLTIIRCEMLIAPLEAQPFKVCLDGFHVLDAFFFRIGVVKTQIAGAAVVFGDSKIQANRLGMPDMQIPIGLGRKAGGNPSPVFAGFEVGIDDISDEIAGRIVFRFTH